MKKVLWGLVAGVAAVVALGLALSLAGHQPPDSGGSGARSGSGPSGGQAHDDTDRRDAEQNSGSGEPGEDPDPDKDGSDIDAQQEGSRALDGPSGQVLVKRIVDGDTLVVSGDGSVLPDRGGLEVRLLEVDTPEIGTCFADKATARTSALLPTGSTIRVERDEDLTDRYGRYLLYVWNDDGNFVNLSLVKGGFAKAVLYQPNDKYWGRISRAGGGAETARAGLWAGCDTAPPPRKKSEPPESPRPAGPDAPGPAPAEPDSSKPEPARPEKPSAPASPPAGGPDLDCSDFPGTVPVGPDDPHRLDRDGDGIGCDAN